MEIILIVLVIILIAAIILNIFGYMLNMYLNNKIWKKHKDKGILNMLISASSSFMRIDENTIIIKNSGATICRDKAPFAIFFMWSRFTINELYIARYTKSYRFLKKQFKLSDTAIDTLVREKQLFGDQIQTMEEK